MITKWFRAAVLAVAASACSDALAPDDVAGGYVLRSIGGNPLPATVPTTGSSVVIVADTLVLRADGSGVRALVTEFQGRAAQRFERPLQFRVVGGLIEITLVCGPNENCTAGPHLVARPQGNGLRVDLDGAESFYQSIL